jgi:hypothetical protein
LTQTTLGNHGTKGEYYDDEKDIHLIIILNSICMIVLLICSLLLRAHQAGIIEAVEIKTVTPSHFTLMAYNIPKHKTSKELKRWLEEHERCKEIRSVSYCYDIRNLI